MKPAVPNGGNENKVSLESESQGIHSFGPWWIQRFFETFSSTPSINPNISTSAKPLCNLVTPNVS
jgi:hypothetical protein